LTDPERRKEYQRNYMRERYWRIKGQAIAELGGQCQECGRREDLEFDHINWRLKASRGDSILPLINQGLPRFWAEVQGGNVQLLCIPCHAVKTGHDRAEQYHERGITTFGARL
jgi:5-methylcytosine-specific restriction endonuclease McrA